MADLEKIRFWPKPISLSQEEVKLLIFVIFLWKTYRCVSISIHVDKYTKTERTCVHVRIVTSRFCQQQNYSWEKQRFVLQRFRWLHALSAANVRRFEPVFVVAKCPLRELELPRYARKTRCNPTMCWCSARSVAVGKTGVGLHKTTRKYWRLLDFECWMEECRSSSIGCTQAQYKALQTFYDKKSYRARVPHVQVKHLHKKHVRLHTATRFLFRDNFNRKIRELWCLEHGQLSTCAQQRNRGQRFNAADVPPV